MLRPVLTRSAAKILLIQNGIGIEEPLRQAFPATELYSAVAYIGVSRETPVRIRHAGGGTLTFGRDGDRTVDDGARQLAGLFAAVGTDARAVDNISYFRWKKMLWNAPFNPLSVLTGGFDTRELMDGGEVEALAGKIMAEIRAVAAAEGIDLKESEIIGNLQYTRDFPAYQTSMLLDFKARRPLEVDAIVGNAVRIARNRGVPVPHLETVFALLRAADRSNRR